MTRRRRSRRASGRLEAWVGKGAPTIRKKLAAHQPGVQKIAKELRKEQDMASPKDMPSRRAGDQRSPIRHVEPPLELDPDALEPVAHQVIEPERSHPHFTPSPRELPEDKDLETFVLEQAEELSSLRDLVQRLRDDVKRLRSEVRSVNAANRQPRDDVNERILELMRRMSPLKTTTNSVAANLELDTNLVGNRMRSLSKSGIIQSTKPGHGGTAVYWIES